MCSKCDDIVAQLSLPTVEQFEATFYAESTPVKFAFHEQNQHINVLAYVNFSIPFPHEWVVMLTTESGTKIVRLTPTEFIKAVVDSIVPIAP